MPLIKLTKSTIEALPLTDRGQILYHDTDLKGFGLVVGAKTKTYVVQRAIHNKTTRCTIGRHGVFTTEEAKREARLLLADMSRGHNPNQVKKQKRIKVMSLEMAMENYLAIKQDLSPRSKIDYKYAIDTYLEDWKCKSLDCITKEMVMQRNASIRTNHGGATATKTMRILSAVYNNAKLFNEALPENPVVILSRAKLWHNPQRRQTIIKAHELKAWYAAVQAHSNQTIRDYLTLLLFTGMRKSEGLRLTWDCLDFAEGTLTLRETKNGHTLKLPMSDFIQQLLQRRCDSRTCNMFVFPGIGKSGHLEEPKKVLRKITEATGIKFMLHDLRRTFVTTAESLEISSYAIKNLVNHKTSNDLTGGYIVFDVNRLRKPVQDVSDRLLELMT